MWFAIIIKKKPQKTPEFAWLVICIELFTLLHNLLASLSNTVEWFITTHTFQYVQTQGQCQHIFPPQKIWIYWGFFVTISTTITCQEITQLAVSSLLLARKLQGHCLNSSFWKRTLNWAPPPVESALSTMLQKIEILFGNYLPSSLWQYRLWSSQVRDTKL